MPKGFAQANTSVKTVQAVRTTQKINIDADLNDEAWKQAPIMKDFIELTNIFGNEELEGNRTEIKILYDNSAIYVSGFCHEIHNDSISSELLGRDVIGVNDFVGVFFDTYNDKINGFGYFVTPLGEQFDAKYSSTGEDNSWNSVYESQVKIVPGGWVFEMKIPYTAIRFSSKVKIQNWGINITRRRRKSGKQYMWSPVDPTIGGNFLAQSGLWTGIEDIKPPVRLSFSPYLSTYINHFPYNDPSIKNTETAINGGLDVKYGINQAFTLDMTLIPDFGQVQSDNQVLNLTPFEVRFNENRTFFTEGTELFGKGSLFYSRRIGGQPIHHNKVNSLLLPGESIAKNPTETKLLNATKISGRTRSGLGIGFFNAIVNPQYATIEQNGKPTRNIETSPLTNYNILVLDQSLKNNSSISLINTNVTRNGTDYDANVTAGIWDLYNKSRSWGVSGKVGYSQLIGFLPNGKTESGYTHKYLISKRGGRFNLEIFQELADSKYNHNDLGYFTNNNFVSNHLWLGYKWLTPTRLFNQLFLNFNLDYSARFKPWDYQTKNINANFNAKMKNLWTLRYWMTLYAQENDFYEPRQIGKVFKRPSSFEFGGIIATNSAKKYALELNYNFLFSKKYHSKQPYISVLNRYRFNTKLTLSLASTISLYTNNIGFATISKDSSIFALRKRTTIENIFTAKYNFNNRMGLSLRARHYWSNVHNRSFFILQQDGELLPTSTNYSNTNYNVNYFNVDMVYTWQFAPGSFVNIVWKNAIGSLDKNIADNYFKNLGNTLSGPQLNSLSLRIIYFLDYLTL